MKQFSDLVFVEDNDTNNIQKFASRLKKLKKENDVEDLNAHKGQLQVALGYLAHKYEFIIKDDDPTGVDYIKNKALTSINNFHAYAKRKEAKEKKRKVLEEKENHQVADHNLNSSLV